MSKMATAGKRLSEFSYRLATLYERDFRDFDAFRDTVRAIVEDDRNDYPNNLQRKIAEREGQKLLAFLDTLRDGCPAVSIPYRRILTGREAEAVAADFGGYGRTIPMPFGIRWTVSGDPTRPVCM